MIDASTELLKVHAWLKRHGYENGLTPEKFESLNALSSEDDRYVDAFYHQPWDDEDQPVGFVCYATPSSSGGGWGTTIFVVRAFASTDTPWLVYGTEFEPHGHDMEPHLCFGSFATLEYALALSCHLHNHDSFEINVIEEDLERGVYVRGQTRYPEACQPATWQQTDRVIQSDLTDQDLLTLIKRNIRCWADFMIARITNKPCEQVVALAREVPVFLENAYITAGSLADSIASTLFCNEQLSNANEYERATQATMQSAKLMPSDYAVFLAACNIGSLDLNHLRNRCWPSKQLLV